jgi:hypothetical protein
MTDLTYAAIVADRTKISDVLLAAHALDEAAPNNGGWTIGAKLFEGLTNARYLLPIAPDRLRCINAVPLAHYCADQDIFRTCMAAWLSQLEGQGQWMIFGTRETKRLVDSITLISTIKGECISDKVRA